jgi:hypothetical protein
MTYDTMTLPVPLTEGELIIKGNELSIQVEDLADIETRKKTAMSAFKEEIDTAEAVIAKLAKIVREKKEYREVEVTERRNEDRMTMDTIRLDTGDVVSYRELRGHERNLGLFPQEVQKEEAGA